MEAGSLRSMCFREFCARRECEAKANEGNIIKGNKQYKSKNKQDGLKHGLLPHVSQGVSKEKHLSLFETEEKVQQMMVSGEYW